MNRERLFKLRAKAEQYNVSSTENEANETETNRLG